MSKTTCDWSALCKQRLLIARAMPILSRSLKYLPFFCSCHRIISHDRIYVEQKESIGGKILLDARTIRVRISPSDRFCRVQNLPTRSVELIWPITELYFRQILSTDFMNRFYLDVTRPNAESGAYSRDSSRCP